MVVRRKVDVSVKLDNNNKAYVNVSWNDTTYTFGTGLAMTDGQVRANVYNVEFAQLCG